MVNFFKEYATDKSLEEDGVWVLISRGIEVKVRRISSKKFNTIVNEALKPYNKYKRNNFTMPMPAKVQEEYDAVMINAVAQGLLLDWKNIEDENDKPLPFSVENAVKLLSEPDFFKEVWEIANAQEAFIRADQEDDVKNSKKPSSGV